MEWLKNLWEWLIDTGCGKTKENEGFSRIAAILGFGIPISMLLFGIIRLIITPSEEIAEWCNWIDYLAAGFFCNLAILDEIAKFWEVAMEGLPISPTHFMAVIICLSVLIIANKFHKPKKP